MRTWPVPGVVGEDEPGTTLCRILNEEGIEREMVMIDPQRPTTVKERFMGRAAARHPNQILRVDSETREPLDRRLEDELVRSLQASIARYDAVLISDYGKGVCTTRGAARDAGGGSDRRRSGAGRSDAD